MIFMAFSLKDGKELIELARKSIKYFFAAGTTMKEMPKEKFSEKQGVFVSLHDEFNELRGCIGFPYPIMPLWNAVIDASVSAGFRDPRFKPLEIEEFEKISIEISVLSVPEEIQGKKEEIEKKIKIGEDGLIVKINEANGLLLPIVAASNKWNAEKFLGETCWKAGLEQDAWKKPETKIFKFQSQVFAEKFPSGSVKEVDLKELLKE